MRKFTFNLNKKVINTVLALTLLSFGSFSQVSGTKSIPGDYPDIASFVADINTNGIGAGGVNAVIAPGFMETAPAGGYVITATGTASDNISIGSIGLPKPIITAPAQTAGNLNDAIFKIVGGDYINIVGLELRENVANTITAAGTNDMTEFGVALFYATPTDGPENCSIINNTIILNRTYQNTFGIYANATHAATTVTTSATATSPAGGINGLKVYGNAISNVNIGIVAIGPTAAANHSTGIDIGGNGLSTGNTITDFGTTGTFSGFSNVSGTINGVLVRNAKNINISYNSITSSNGGVTGGTIRGIFVPAFSNTPTGTYTNTISNNSVSIKSGAAGNAILGIHLDGTTTTATSTSNITNNDFNNFGHTVAGTSTITLIQNASTTGNLNITGNTFSNISVNTTGTFYCINNNTSLPTFLIDNNSVVGSLAKTGVGGIVYGYYNFGSPGSGTATISNNNFSNISVTGATTFYGIRQYTSTSQIEIISNNVVNNISGGTNQIYGISHGYGAAGSLVSGNIVSNMTNNASVTAVQIGDGTAGTVNCFNNTVFGITSTSGTVIGIGQSNGASTRIYNNKIYNLESNNATGLTYGMSVSSGTNAILYNNVISDLRAPISGDLNALRGISLTSTSTSSNILVYNNSIYLNGSSSATDFGTSGIFHTASATATTAALDLRNNIIINESTASGTGLTVAFRRSSAALNNFSTTSNNNTLFAGVPSASRVIFYDGTTAQQTLANYQTLVAPRENLSGTGEGYSYGTPGSFFISLTGSSADFLKPVGGIATLVESGATAITTPINLSTDFAAVTRATFVGYAGTGTAPDRGAFEFEGTTPAPVIVLNSMTPNQTAQCTNVARNISADITTLSGTITSAVLNYTINGVAQTPINMTGAGSTYTAIIPTVTPANATVTWNLVATNSSGIIATYVGATYSDEPLTGLSASAMSNPGTICNGETSTLTAMLFGPSTQTIGSATTTSTSAGTNPFYGGYGGVKSQYIIRASELIAAGFTAGNITSVGIDITSAGSNLTDFAINAEMTALTALTTDIIDVPTNRFSTASFVPAVGINTFTFSTPINWNGTSNIILSFCWSNNNTSNTASAIRYSSPGFTSSNARYVDSRTAAEVCGYIGTTLPTGWNGAATTTGNRPNFTFNGIASSPITSVSWKDGTMTEIGTTNPLNVSPSATTMYTADITAMGCLFTPSPTTTVTVNPLPAAVTASNSVQCGAQVPTASVTSNTGASTPTFVWYTTLAGTTVAQSSTSTTFTNVVSTDTTFYVSELNSVTGCESPRTAISVTVTPADPIQASTSDVEICIGDNFTLTASNTNGVPVQNYAYSWLGATGSGVETSQNGTVINVTPTSSGVFTYDLTGVDGSCSNTASVVVTVNALPVIDSPMASPSTVCSGDTIFLTADNFGVSPTAIVPIGAGALTSSSSYNTPFYHLYGGVKEQYIIRASELTAAGIIAGNINSLGINVTTAGVTYNGFTLHIAHTANTVASTTLVPAASLTEVYNNPTLALTPNSLNTFTFSTPFNWDGVSNIIVQTSWSNNNGGGTSAGLQYDAVPYVALAYYRADNQTPATVLAANTGTGTLSSRPKFTFNATATTNISNLMSWQWTPGTNLNTDDTSVVIVNNTGSPIVQAFTVTLTNPTTGCVNTATTADVTINPAELAPVATNSAQCGTGVPTASVTGSGNSGNTFEWYLSPTGGSPIAGESGATLSSYSINTTTTFYVGESNGLCVSPLTPVTVTVTPPPAISASGTNVLCLNDTGVLTATSSNDPNYTYTWSNGLGTGATVNATPTATTTYTVTATDMSGGANNGCITSSQITVTVNPLPATAPVTASTSEICINDEIILLTSSIADTVTIGTGTTAPGSTSWPNPLSAWYGGAKHQMIYTAAELSAQGLSAGSDITSVGFNVATATGGACVDFTIRMKHTASATLSGFEVGTTTVYGPATYTPSATGPVHFNLSTPFIWDGTSNVIVETVHNSGNSGNGSGTTTFASSTATAMTYRRAADNVAGGVPGFDALTTSVSQGTTTNRTNVIFSTFSLPTWSPSSELFTDAAATISYTGTSIDSVYANLSTTSEIYAVYTNGFGCMDSTSQLITINQLPIVDAGVAQTICNGDDVILSGSGAVSYSWDNSVVDGVVFNPSSTATYTVTGTDANGCVNTDMVDVTVNALPNATVTDNGNATITAGAATTYQWFDCGSNMILPGQTSQTLTVTANGVYSVIVTNANGCVDTSACIFIGNVGVKELNGSTTSIYPNPTHNNVTIEFTMTQATIEVIDALGATLETKVIKSGDVVSLADYNRGVYFIKVKSDSGTTLHRIVKN